MHLRGANGRGLFLTFEGPDGVGKTTQAENLVGRLRAEGLEVISLREPGGTSISEQIRGLVLDSANAEMTDECELLLYEASRAQLVRQEIAPAIERGALVVCDRYCDSTLAYQAGGRGLDEALVRRANELGCCGVMPDLTLVLDLDPTRALTRATSDGADRMEAAGTALQRRVRASYLALAADEPRRVRIIDAAGTVAEVAMRIDAELARVGLGRGCERGGRR